MTHGMVDTLVDKSMEPIDPKLWGAFALYLPPHEFAGSIVPWNQFGTVGLSRDAERRHARLDELG